MANGQPSCILLARECMVQSPVVVLTKRGRFGQGADKREIMHKYHQSGIKCICNMMILHVFINTELNACVLRFISGIPLFPGQEATLMLYRYVDSAEIL